MNDRKYKIPEAGLAVSAHPVLEYLRAVAPHLLVDYEKAAYEIAELAGKAFIRWQSENPVMPIEEWMGEQIQAAHPSLTASTFSLRVIAEWLRRMYLAPAEPEVPAEVKDLFTDTSAGGIRSMVGGDESNRRVLEAYRRGQKNLLPVQEEPHEADAHRIRCEEFFNRQ